MTVHRPARRLGGRLHLALALVLLLTSAFMPAAALAAPAGSSQGPGGQERWVRVYTVRPGDTLSAIALKYDVTVAALMEANHLDSPHRIVAGQDLIIPDAQGGKPGTGGPECAASHVVRRGDTLSGIAYAYGLDEYELARANGIYDLNEVYIGQRLCIPGRAKSQAPPSEPQRPVYQEPQPPAQSGPQRPPDKPEAPKNQPQPGGPQQPSDRPGDGPPYEGPPQDGCPPCGTPEDKKGPDGPPRSDEYWKGSYFKDKYFSEFVEERKDTEIRFNWYTGSPFNGLPEDRFSVRWEKVEYFKAGWYRFVAVADDGVRVIVDDQTVIDGWKIQPATEYKGDIFIHEGTHKLVVEYYEEAEDAQISVEWRPIRK